MPPLAIEPEWSAGEEGMPPQVIEPDIVARREEVVPSPSL